MSKMVRTNWRGFFASLQLDEQTKLNDKIERKKIERKRNRKNFTVNIFHRTDSTAKKTAETEKVSTSDEI